MSMMTPFQQGLFDYLSSELDKTPDPVMAEHLLCARCAKRVVEAIAAQDRVALTWELQVMFTLGKIGVHIETLWGIEQLNAWVQALVILNHQALERGERVPGYGGVPEELFWCRPAGWTI
jgi:hypothetical protein